MANEQEIGTRIERYRNAKGWTQQELANRMGMSRSSVTQIEQGNRKVSALELFRFSRELEFNLSRFFTGDPGSDDNGMVFPEKHEEPPSERISVPSDKVNFERFKTILLYILEKCAGKPNVGETVLYKLLYFADFNHYEEHEKFLTGSVYRKLPYGPVPLHLNQVFEKMIERGELQRIKAEYHGYPQTRYLPLNKPDLEKLTGAEKDTLDQVIDRYSDWSASAISDYSHEDMPWKATQEGDVIDYELAFYREPPFSARNYDYEEPEKSDV